MSRHRARQESRSTKQGSRAPRHTKQGKAQRRKQPRKLVAPTVAFTVALTGGNALAQDQEVLTAPPIEVREQRPGYTVPNLGLSRLPEPIRDIPQSITVVPQELIQGQGVTNLRDALRNVTGISFQAGEGVVLRGITSRCVALTPAMISFSTAYATRGPTFGTSSTSRRSRC